MEFTIKSLELQNAQMRGIQPSPTEFEYIAELKNLINIRTAKLHEYVTGQALELEKLQNLSTAIKIENALGK